MAAVGLLAAMHHVVVYMVTRHTASRVDLQLCSCCGILWHTGGMLLGSLPVSNLVVMMVMRVVATSTNARMGLRSGLITLSVPWCGLDVASSCQLGCSVALFVAQLRTVLVVRDLPVLVLG